MKRQFVSEVGILSAAWHSKKAEDLIAFVKRYEHALLSDAEELPSTVLTAKISKLCAKLDAKFPKTMHLLVDNWRGKLYNGMHSKVSVKPARRDGSFSDSYWIMITLIDVKNDINLSNDQIKQDSLLVNILNEEGGES